jgi:hypothetical protein
MFKLVLRMRNLIPDITVTHDSHWTSSAGHYAGEILCVFHYDRQSQNRPSP